MTIRKSPLRLLVRQDQRHIRLYREEYESPAFRSLSPAARALLLEFLMVCVPSRNGRLVLPVARAAKRLGVSENTVRKAYDDLLEKGFIAIREEAQWQNGRAREYRLTFEQSNGREPTDEWRDWTPDRPIWRSRRRRTRREK